jgi:hypothetical protein
MQGKATQRNAVKIAQVPDVSVEYREPSVPCLRAGKTAGKITFEP